MKSFVINYSNNNKGLTLIELLIALTISAVVIGIITPIFINGIKNYHAINNEVQLRNEADYIIGTILNEIYHFYPDTVEQLDEGTKIKMTRSFIVENPETENEVKRRFIVDDGILSSPDTLVPETLVIEIKNNKVSFIYDNGIEKQINSSDINVITENEIEFENEEGNDDDSDLLPLSSITLLGCAKERPCKNGTLQITLVLDFVQVENKRNQTLVLTSTFGF